MNVTLFRNGTVVTSDAHVDTALAVSESSIAGKGGSPRGEALSRSLVGASDVLDFDAPVLAFESGGGYHVAALLGIALLAVIGGALVARDRLDSRRKTESTAPVSATENVMTDREKVCHLVKENGGRMKQSEIVDSVEWSKAKVSRLLADLETEGEITKLRLGRENLICLPDNEPAASRSSERRPGE